MSNLLCHQSSALREGAQERSVGCKGLDSLTLISQTVRRQPLLHPIPLCSSALHLLPWYTYGMKWCGGARVEQVVLHGASSHVHFHQPSPQLQKSGMGCMCNGWIIRCTHYLCTVGFGYLFNLIEKWYGVNEVVRECTLALQEADTGLILLSP